MSLEYGLIIAFAIVAFGGAALAGFVLWLRNSESDGVNRNHESIKHA